MSAKYFAGFCASAIYKTTKTRCVTARKFVNTFSFFIPSPVNYKLLFVEYHKVFLGRGDKLQIDFQISQSFFRSHIESILDPLRHFAPKIVVKWNSLFCCWYHLFHNRGLLFRLCALKTAIFGMDNAWSRKKSGAWISQSYIGKVNLFVPCFLRLFVRLQLYLVHV